ncbi:MAG: hypothetical protein GF329_12715 [Candidatus Lokiarchaeota archaeon]|nr:hypothetical protein [Candidatus Lokiarchaeota archaeon]
MELELVEIPEICPLCEKKINLRIDPKDFREGKGGLWQFAIRCPHLDENGNEHVVVISIDKDYRVRRKYGYPLKKITSKTIEGLSLSSQAIDTLVKLFKNEALKWAIYQKEFDFFMNNIEILRVKLVSNVDEIAKMNEKKISMRFVHMLDEDKRLIEYIDKLADIQFFMEFLITLIYLERVKAVEFLLD